MSNQENGFQGSQPFITYKQFQNLSLDEIKHIIANEKEQLKKDYTELQKRNRLIREYKRVMKLREKVKQGVDIKKKNKSKTHVKDKKIKTFDEYFDVVIKNKKIPKDTPDYLRKALKQAKKEFDTKLKKEKSALEDFAAKYNIKGEEGEKPQKFFKIINILLEIFLVIIVI